MNKKDYEKTIKMIEMDKIEQLIERNHLNWKRWYGHLSVRKSTKFVNGKNTGIPSITFYVVKKLKCGDVNKVLPIPDEIAGIRTDVVELSTRDYELGVTNISKLSPEVQRRLSSGVKKK